MPRLLHSAALLHEKHKRQIYNLIHKFELDGVADFEDLESLSNEVFVRCLDKWEPEKASFSTFLHVALRNAFLSELAKGKRRTAYEDQAATKAPTTQQPRDGGLWLRDFLNALDADAKKVVASILKDETTPTKKKLNKGTTKLKVAKELTKKPSWTMARVNRAFDNIKQALKNV